MISENVVIVPRRVGNENVKKIKNQKSNSLKVLLSFEFNFMNYLVNDQIIASSMQK